MSSHTIQRFFQIGMKRALPELLPNHGKQLEFGPGNTPYGCSSLEYPDWDADSMDVPEPDNSIDTIHMYHFLEHVESPIKLLRECERILVPGGHINIVVPHQACSLAYEDLDHKTFFVEDTIPKLLHNKGHEKNNGWQLAVHINFMMAIVHRNLSIFTQLVKTNADYESLDKCGNCKLFHSAECSKFVGDILVLATDDQCSQFILDEVPF